MPPYELLYGRRCRTPICWVKVGQKKFGGTEVVLEMNQKIDVIRARLKAAQDRQKWYSEKNRRPIEFQVGNMMKLKVSPWKGVIRFQKRGKFAPWIIGPFKVLARVGEVSYRLELPEELARIHKTFHVSYLCKCLADDSMWVPLNEVTLNNKLEYVEEPITILDEKVKVIRNKRIRTYKVQWRHRKGSECT
ncbi:uncharacterized protein [Rutidosis leptorrhynchoides]|uniref:uncharacterized protein n=1 Tax=Rutidosis leptorrhynchoides TaxID=125765 RepID=UPI003A99A468